MVRLTNHLEFLLAEHDCVVIPGIGGFVMRTLPSVYNKEEHSFSPMRKEIVFNCKLTHTDGLLVSSYAKIYGKVSEEAQTMVEEDVAELEAALNQCGKVSLGSIGTLARGEEGQLIFTTGNVDTLGSDTYDLPTFSIPALPPTDKKAERLQQKKDAAHAGRHKWLAPVIVAAAISAGLIWYMALPEKQQEETAFSTPPVEVSTPVEVEEKVKEEVIKEKEVIREAKKETISATKKTELEAKGSDAAKKGKYYVVIGSFPIEKKALTALKAYKRSGGKPNAGVLHRDGRYRVYAGNYAARADANAALAQIRRDMRYKDAWLFISK
ncbi:MAG: SPOR domain-containing protein [Tannerellaceae bacterium]|jgi:hypothetical protein|nr:SPOR domain-containing protein [Tannerellaceae bacterium]